MGYSIKGVDFKGLLAHEFTSEPESSTRTGEMGTPPLIQFATRNASTPNLSIVHFKADFHRDVQVQKLQDISHLSLHFQLSGHSDAAIRGISGNQPLTAGEYNLYYCDNPETDFLFPKQDGYSYVAFIVEEGYLVGLADTLGGEALGQIAARVTHRVPFALFPSPMVMDRAIRQILFDVLHVHLPEDLGRLYLQGKFLELLSLALTAGVPRHPPGAAIGREDVEKLEWVHSYIGRHYLDSLSLGELSRKSCLNEFKLKKGFRERYSVTVFGFITDLRLNHARLLLRSGCQVSEVALEVGYSSPGSFIQAFKRKFGVTPSFFR